MVAEDAKLGAETAKEFLILNLNEATRRSLETRLETSEDPALQLLSVDERLQMVTYEKVLTILKSTAMLEEATRRTPIGKVPAPKPPPKPKAGATGALAGFMSGVTRTCFVGYVGMASGGPGGS